MTEGGNAGASSFSVPKFSQGMFEKLLGATKISNEFPVDDDFSYYGSIPEYKEGIKEIGDRTLSIVTKLMKYHAGGYNSDALRMEDLDDVIDKFDGVVDVVDGVLENVDALLDEAAGVFKTPLKGALNPTVISLSAKKENAASSVHIARPQMSFPDKIDNSRSTPFVPKLTEKPHAVVPLHKADPTAQSPKISPEMEKHLKELGVTRDGKTSHPYEHEIVNVKYRGDQLSTRQEQLYKPMKDTPFTWVDNPEMLDECIGKLNGASEIAVDLEHHNYRSFQGFLCLMQISTRDEDFVIDTIELRGSLHALIDVFANPRIVKVLHGADHDVLWLQRDFGLYIVNMFDTGQAARVLTYPSFSLAYLLKYFCGEESDKKYQLADWRVRPIPSEMLKYARMDTHFLLYIYDRLTNELLAKSTNDGNLLHSTLSRSSSVALKVYDKPPFNPEQYLSLYNRHNVDFNEVQLAIFAALYDWRDQVARNEDESVRYVMPNYTLFVVSEQMPSTTDKLLLCCKPIPPLVRMNAADILRIINEVRTGMMTSEQAAALAAESAVKNGAGAASAMDISREDAASPVLTTEQLYRAAGWVDNGASSTLGNFNVAATSLDGDEQLKSFLGPDAGKNLAANAPKPVVVSTSEYHGMGEGPMPALMFSDDDDDEGDDGESGDESEGDKMSKELAARITQSFGSDPRLAFMDETKAAPASAPATGDVAMTEAVEVKQPKKSDSSNGGGDDDEQELVPKSFAEIYKLSNRNRKRNKEKKKRKKEEADDMGDDDDMDNRDDCGDGNANTFTAEDSISFMKSVGWVDKEQPAKELIDETFGVSEPDGTVGGGCGGRKRAVDDGDAGKGEGRRDSREKEKDGSSRHPSSPLRQHPASPKRQHPNSPKHQHSPAGRQGGNARQGQMPAGQMQQRKGTSPQRGKGSGSSFVTYDYASAAQSAPFLTGQSSAGAQGSNPFTPFTGAAAGGKNAGPKPGNKPSNMHSKMNQRSMTYGNRGGSQQQVAWPKQR